MKRILSLIFAILIVGSMFALDFDWDGEFRSRSAMYNDDNGTPGGHTDNRLRLGFNSEIHPILNVRALLEMGHTWGELDTTIGGDINVTAKEAYIDLMLDAIKSRVKVGFQPWADHRSMVLDYTFSGISVLHELSPEMSFQAGFGKYWEGANDDRYDDLQGFLFSFNNEADLSYGADAYFTWTRNHVPGTDPFMLKFISMAPYVNLKLDPVVLDAMVIFQLKDSYDWINDDVETDTAFGAAVNVSGDMEPLEWNADLLFIGEEDLWALSNYYQNNLYLLGTSEIHDDLGIYAYTTAADSYIGLTGQAKFALSEKIKFFGAAGFVNGAGIEVNGGMEYSVIPDVMGLVLYGARAFMDEDLANKDPYALGATLQVEF